jgi:PAS domain S-box-containing protein
MGAGLELYGRRKDGTEFPVEISLSPLQTEEATLAISAIRDITERKRAEQKFDGLLESAPDAMVIVDQSGTIVLVNGQTQTLFGYRREELLGQAVELLLPERFRDRHVIHRASYMANPGTRPMGVGLELAGRRKDGSEFPVDISLSAIETEEGILATAFVRDITERAAEAELKQRLAERRILSRQLVSVSEAERKRIAGDIHDDSIQAITAAGLRLQILRRSLEDEQQLALLADLEETIQLSITRLRHLVFELRPPALDREGLSEALRLYLDETRGESETQFRLDDRLESQPGEEPRVILYRIAKEALTNVRKHAQAANAQITLLERADGYRIRITDDGMGFDVARAAPAPGHLGLASMRERAELVGGWLHVDSSPQAGTTVEFWIPSTLEASPTEQSVHGG